MAKKIDAKKLEEELVGVQNQLKRAVADYRNLEKRVTDNGLLVAEYAKGEVILKILPALDSLDQAVEGAGQAEAESAWLKGVLMSLGQLRQALSEEGLVEIGTEGSFDPRFHEAVEVKEGEDGKILEVAQRGYTLNEKVLRPAKVVVGKSSFAKATEDDRGGNNL